MNDIAIICASAIVCVLIVSIAATICSTRKSDNNLTYAKALAERGEKL